MSPIVLLNSYTLPKWLTHLAHMIPNKPRNLAIFCWGLLLPSQAFAGAGGTASSPVNPAIFLAMLGFTLCAGAFLRNRK